MSPADAEVAVAMKVAIGERILAIDRLLCADGDPMAVSWSWLSPAVLGRHRHPTLEELDARSLYAWIAEHCGVRIVGGEEFIEAAIADDLVARRLEIAPGSPTLVTRRTARSENGGPIEYVVLHYRADRYRFRVELGLS